jgi:hypothetical protein
MSDFRIGARDGHPITFSCENYSYRTNIEQGHPHSPVTTRGSVAQGPLVQGDTGYTLWLEHVTDKRDPGAELYWLMWYDTEGKPTVTMSSVFGPEQLEQMRGRLSLPRIELAQSA